MTDNALPVNHDLESAHDLRERALIALRDGQFDLAEQLLSSGNISFAELVENLRIYQAELQIQNEELRRSQAEREEAFTRLHAFFTTMPVAEVVVDRQGLIMETNPRAEELFGLSSSHLHQHFFVRLVEEKDRGKVIHSWSRLDRNEVVVLHELRFRNGDNHPFIGDLHIARLAGDVEDRHRYVCAVLDRTEDMRVRYELQSAHQQLLESEQRYRIVAQFSPDWEYWLGTDGHFVYISPACETITGYSAEELMADPALLGRLIIPEDRAIYLPHFDQARDGNTEHDTECLHFRIRTRNGDIRWIEHYCQPVTGTDGRALGRRGVNRDITERKRTEQALQESEQLYRALFETAADGLAVLQDGRFLSINQAALTMLGYAKAEAVIGRTPDELSPPLQPDGEASATKAARLLTQALHHDSQAFDWDHLRADRQLLPLTVTLVRIKQQGTPALLAIWRHRVKQPQLVEEEFSHSA